MPAQAAPPAVLSAVNGMYSRLHSERRREVVREAFDAASWETGKVFGVAGPPDSGKTAVALAAIDRHKHLGVLPDAPLQAPSFVLAPDSGFAVLCDNADQYSVEQIASLAGECRGKVPLIVCARNEHAVRAALAKERGDRLIRLHSPDVESLALLVAEHVDFPAGSEQAVRLAAMLCDAGCGLSAARSVLRDARLQAEMSDEPLQEEQVADAIATFEAERAGVRRGSGQDGTQVSRQPDDDLQTEGEEFRWA